MSKDKLQEYIDNGTQLGWLINPQQEQVEIYRPSQGVEIWPNSRPLAGENVLPGFVLDWQRIITNH
nr:Uma2 family endonuclease [Spirulina subsalsa]